MKRRGFLVTAAGTAMAGLAGCSDLVSESDPSENIRESSDERVEFVSHRLATIGTTPFPGQQERDPNATDVEQADISGAVAGRVQNASDSTIAVLRVTAWFYDTSSGRQLLGEESLELEDLEPDEQRSFFITILDRETTEEVDDYELAAEVVE